ncbi:uncharacterized protein LOC110025093 [Phalaenopsis equestris]|uniref:uncharacterized protein LOC110025093 n=1 Tax=Phalaenopsis equestris TaxID=78828 RepID=UPI0009E4836B|nr:uncharacterized protein LOC110025093 [Phalaenopsis equestris]
MRGVNGHDSLETVAAAANAIASAGSRVQPGSVRRRRWKAWLDAYWCFGSHSQPTRISQSVLVPEPTEDPISPTLANSNQSSGLIVAPPSSPSSFLHSEPPSTMQSPAKFFSLSSLASNSYSPPRSSIFAIGPYANDTKLVSPPVFSNFTTEPSTAPFTPPEPLQHTTPSSPEVPFAQLLSPSFNSNGKITEPYDFHPYQLHPGSPIGHLISPGSICSGTSSPFPDMELYPSVQPPKILTAQDFTKSKLLNGRAAKDNGSILDGRITAIHPFLDESGSILANSAGNYDEDVAFEFTAREFAQRMKKQPETSIDVIPVSPMDLGEAIAKRDKHTPNGISHNVSEIEASKEFKFNVETENGDDKELGILHSGSAWSQLKFGFVERTH